MDQYQYTQLYQLWSPFAIRPFKKKASLRFHLPRQHTIADMMTSKTPCTKSLPQSSSTSKRDLDPPVALSVNTIGGAVDPGKAAADSKTGLNQSPKKTNVDKKAESKNNNTNHEGKPQIAATKGDKTVKGASTSNSQTKKKPKLTYESTLDLLDEAVSVVGDQQELENEKCEELETYVSTLEDRIQDLEERMGHIERQYEVLDEIREGRKDIKRKAEELEDSLEELMQQIKSQYGDDRVQ